MNVFYRVMSACVVAAIIIGVAGRIWMASMQRSIYVADPVALLSACREMINNRAADSIGTNPSSAKTSAIVIDDKRRLNAESIPSIVRQLKPVRITLDKDRALICVWPYPRIYVIGFSAGAKEYGTKKIVDGLWYYNGRIND